jgi:hypothetical protein
MRKLCTILSVLLLASLLMQPAAGAKAITSKPTIGVESTDPTVGTGKVNRTKTQKNEDSNISQTSTSLIADGESVIRKTASGKVNVSGYTQTYNIASIIGFRITLQQWTGSSWSNIKTWSFEGAKAAYISDNSDYYVSKNYYYRVVCTHYASDVTGYQELSSVSSYILVD